MEDIEDRNGFALKPMEKLDKLIKILNEYAKIVDVAIGHQPEVVSLVWGGIRLLMKVNCMFQHLIPAN